MYIGVKMAKAVLLLVLGILAAAQLGHAASSVVTEWLLAAQATVSALEIDHQQAARLYAEVAIAQHDAILTARSYAQASISDEVAAAYASHAVLSHLFYWRQSTIYDPLLSRQLAQMGAGDDLLPVLRSLIIPDVWALIKKRLADNASVYDPYKPSSGPGKYQVTPGQTTMGFPQLAAATGFYLTRKDVDFYTRSMKSFALNDPEYEVQLKKVYAVGSSSSVNRTAYQTNTAYLWAAGLGTSTLAGAWLNISIALIPDSTPLLHQARFFKLMGSAFFDTAIACWKAKYGAEFWRPITAIRTFDAAWTPLLPTPFYPEYPSAHMCTSGAAVYLLEAYLGNTVSFTYSSPSVPNVAARTYPSFAAAATEIGASRVFAGVHFDKANKDGYDLGFAIAQGIHRRFFKGVTFKDAL